MDNHFFYALAADTTMLIHALFVAFVVLGLPLTWLGHWRQWQWVYNHWFRLSHLLAIGIVVAQSWLSIRCPLTTLEMKLRALAGETSYQSAFIVHWVERLLYIQAPGWVFVMVYTLFGLIVLATWFWIRPGSR